MTERGTGAVAIDPAHEHLLGLVSRLARFSPFQEDARVWFRGVLTHGGALPGGGGDRGAAQRHPRGPERGALREALERALLATHAALRGGAAVSPRLVTAYEEAALFSFWERWEADLDALIASNAVDVPFWDALAARHQRLFDLPGRKVPEPAHLLALLYQGCRAHAFIAQKIRGRSASAEAARVALWRAIFGRDLGTYADGLYRRMDPIPVLITGETGTGKELAAQCIGWSRYLPFDPKTKRFVARYADQFHARNLCEHPRDLVESALFGHKRGSFSGAVADHAGWFALPGEHGVLFLDEIGELPEHVQVKLLRPLQTREHLPLGDTQTRRCLGRFLFATHQDLDALCERGSFRPDLYERLNGVRIHMPPLRTMLAERPDDLGHYVRGFLAERLDDLDRVDDEAARFRSALEADRPGYAWPRNLRELKNTVDQFVCSGEIPPVPALRGSFLPAAATPTRAPAPPPPRVEAPPARPPSAPPPGPAAPASEALPSSGLLGSKAKRGHITLEELSRSYVTRVHALSHGNASETARRTGIDRRAVLRWIDPARLAQRLPGGK